MSGGPSTHNIESEISHSNDRDHGHDATSRSHGRSGRRYPRKSLCGPCKSPFAYRGSSRCTRASRLSPWRSSRLRCRLKSSSCR
jgi:hypothetical protein